jgi:hypothetical protein
LLLLLLLLAAAGDAAAGWLGRLAIAALPELKVELFVTRRS